MIGWPGEVRAEANAVYTALTQGERTHWVVAKWQFVKTASLANRLLRLPLTRWPCLSREHRPMYQVKMQQLKPVHAYLALPAPKETTRSDTGYDGARSQS